MPFTTEMKKQKRSERESVPGIRGAFFILSRRAHLLTTCHAGGGIPPCGRARALFTDCPPDTPPEGTAHTETLYGAFSMSCADGFPLYAEQTSQSLTVSSVDAFVSQVHPAIRLQKSADNVNLIMPQTFSSCRPEQNAKDCLPACFLLQRQKKQKRLPMAEKGSDQYWQFTTWKPKL